ncbi:hypothetical protein [Thermodesulfatator autotrophicus]|uniref:Uncharacterized protein n=1 Tax=Thermodesulfatator autotrophicus TaxID=1795632 RepID=A0A177E711_9BACT|nr:hypothetical protein [Thermodesulfatator autotrophicus]OAG27012.1 hypothetical protein TH606_09215 [Thermodesulfatator autotrophicus]
MKEETKRWNWDYCNDPELILVRRMLYDNPLDLLKKHEKNILKETFLKNIHFFKRENFTFWKLILDISDEEIKQRTKKSFRTSCEIWRF